MDKNAVRLALLSLEEDALQHAREHYLEYVADARLDRSEPIRSDEQAHAGLASELMEAFDQPVHAHSEKIRKLKTIDFGPKSVVEEGAVVKLGDRYFVIAVSTNKFECDGHELMGISVQAPIFKAIEGKKAGEDITFNGRTLPIEEVY